MFFFYGILFLTPGYWIINIQHQTERSIIERRELTRFSLEELGLRSIYDNFTHKNYSGFLYGLKTFIVERNLPRRIEEAARDQFPIRLQLIRLEKFLERAIISLAYLPLEDDVIPISFTSDLHIIKEQEFLLYPPIPFTEEVKANIDQRIDNYSTMISSYPEKNFYVYFIKQMQYSELNPLFVETNSSDIELPVDYFITHKPVSLSLDVLDFRSLGDYMDAFYKTDFHWNNHGVLLAYSEIYELLSTNYSEISDPVQFKGFTRIPDLNFLGNAARLSYYPLTPEPFEILEYSIPEYKAIYKGEYFSYNHIDQYLNGQFSQEKYATHYGNCFGDDLGFIEFISENNSPRNLLVIGDSFDNPLLPILTAHYKHLYSVDLRHINDFRLSDFFAANPVDDVLVIGDYDVVFGSMEWVIPLD